MNTLNVISFIDCVISSNTPTSLVSHFATHCRCRQYFVDHPPVLWSHPRWIQFWANASHISWNVPMSWTARDDPSPKCLCCSCSPNPCSANCASRALKDVWDAGIKICRFATTCFFSNVCPLPLKINVTVTCLWRLWLMTKVLTVAKYRSCGAALRDVKLPIPDPLVTCSSFFTSHKFRRNASGLFPTSPYPSIYIQMQWGES